MIAHTVLYVILSILSVTAVYAAVTPVQKPSQEQIESGQEQKEDGNSLEE